MAYACARGAGLGPLLKVKLLPGVSCKHYGWASRALSEANRRQNIAPIPFIEDHMRKLLGTLALGIFVLAGIGLARGWLSFSSESGEGTEKLEISIDKEQLKEDTSKLKEGAKEIADRFSGGEGNSEPAEGEPSGDS